MERVKMTVEMDVTPAQALALQAMFKHWNLLANIGASRQIAFKVDGDGNFRPNCKVKVHSDIPELTPELQKLAIVSDDGYGNLVFDFDNIAWKIKQ